MVTTWVIVTDVDSHYLLFNVTEICISPTEDMISSVRTSSVGDCKSPSYYRHAYTDVNKVENGT